MLIPLLALVLLGCGGGDRITQTREVAPFDRLDIEDGVDVKVVPGDAREVRVYAGEDVIDRVHTESSDGVLHVDIRDRGIVIGDDPLGDARVEVSASALRSVSIGGTSDVKLTDVDVEELELDVEGAGDIDASGTVDRLSATIEGAGNANLSNLAVRTAVVVVEGAGDADLNVSDSLDVTIEGAADVTYRGDPQIRSDIEGAGDLRRDGP
jgi:Putative auto-transporter adhesin, head GIN domain